MDVHKIHEHATIDMPFPNIVYDNALKLTKDNGT